MLDFSSRNYFITRQEIIQRINEYVQKQQPFLFLIDFDAVKGFVMKPEEADAAGIKYQIGRWSNFTGEPVRRPGVFNFKPVTIETYKKAFDKVQFHLKNGDTYLLNLTFPTPLETDRSLAELFATGTAPYKLLVPGHFVVFSPEAFVSINDGMIVSSPMKGTISAAFPDAEQRLLNNEKEFYEHNTIVDLIRNDLSIVSTGVKVNRFRYIDRLRTNRGDLLQMSSEISGKLSDDYREKLGELLFKLLPAGSVTGAPKEKTVQIIRDAEGYNRGFYTGIFGFFDGSSLISAVTIRFIEDTGNGLVFKSGGGITAMSELHEEYNEMTEKIYVPAV